jgi:hypothetical protein
MRLSESQKKAIINHILCDVPTVDYLEQARKLVQAAYLKKLPKAVQVIAKDTGLSKHLDKSYINLGHLFGYSRVTVPGTFSSSDLDGVPDVDEIGKLNKAQEDRLRELKIKLNTSFAAVNTRKQALELFPGFEKYLPVETKPERTMPVVTDTITALTESGWPKKSGDTKKNKKAK